MPDNRPFGRIIRTLDSVSLLVGNIAAVLTLVLALVTGLVVIMRYGFGTGSIALQESANYLHASAFMLGAAYTLKVGGHVRVDIFYRGFSARTRAWIDCVGAIVLLAPLCIFIAWVSWDFVARAWEIHEVSPDPGGLPFVYLLKSLLPVLALSLLCQGLAEVLRNLAILMAGEDTMNA